MLPNDIFVIQILQTAYLGSNENAWEQVKIIYFYFYQPTWNPLTMSLVINWKSPTKLWSPFAISDFAIWNFLKEYSLSKHVQCKGKIMRNAGFDNSYNAVTVTWLIHNFVAHDNQTI